MENKLFTFRIYKDEHPANLINWIKAKFLHTETSKVIAIVTNWETIQIINGTMFKGENDINLDNIKYNIICHNPQI